MRNEFDDIVDDFDVLEDWEDRYRYIIDLGKKMPAMADKSKVEENKVNGCASQVWIKPENIPAIESDKVGFQGDSDALIVRGLIAIILTLYNNKTVKEAKNIDSFAELDRLGLRSHLSAQRSNGLTAMISKLNEFCESY
tara:strand:- start:1040 stop:1456 length:417 start_codon:yes stop_codon:yes gene_type:complete